MTLDMFNVYHWAVLRGVITRENSRRCSNARHFTPNYSTSSRMNHILYVSPIDAEPLHRDEKGGYHPIALGDTLRDGRYKVLHKLGWGGYSTVWAARDQRSVLTCC